MLQGHRYGASVSRGVPVYSPAFAGTKLYCLVTEAHRCEKLAQSFYAAVPRRDSYPRPLDRESDTLPQHHDDTKVIVSRQNTGFPLSWLQKIPGLFQDPQCVFAGLCRSPAMINYRQTAVTDSVYTV